LHLAAEQGKIGALLATCGGHPLHPVDPMPSPDSHTRAAVTRNSLLCTSAGMRLAGAGAALLVLWTTVFWAFA